MESLKDIAEATHNVVVASSPIIGGPVVLFCLSTFAAGILIGIVINYRKAILSRISLLCKRRLSTAPESSSVKDYLSKQDSLYLAETPDRITFSNNRERAQRAIEQRLREIQEPTEETLSRIRSIKQSIGIPTNMGVIQGPTGIQGYARVTRRDEVGEQGYFAGANSASQIGFLAGGYSTIARPIEPVTPPEPEPPPYVREPDSPGKRKLVM